MRWPLRIYWIQKVVDGFELDERGLCPFLTPGFGRGPRLPCARLRSQGRTRSCDTTRYLRRRICLGTARR